MVVCGRRGNRRSESGGGQIEDLVTLMVYLTYKKGSPGGPDKRVTRFEASHGSQFILECILIEEKREVECVMKRSAQSLQSVDIHTIINLVRRCIHERGKICRDSTLAEKHSGMTRPLPQEYRHLSTH